MNNKPIFILIIILVIAGLGIYFWSGSPDTDQAMTSKEEIVTEKSGVVEKTVLNSGSYDTYALEKLAAADSGKVVLFFKAPWCPTCRVLDSDIKSNLDKIPEGVVILDVDYDNSTSLKQKYGVTYQHTLVQVDSQGNQLAKWQGSPTLADLISKLK